MDKLHEESRKKFEIEFKRQYCNVPASRTKLMLELHNHGTEENPDWGYHSIDAQNAWEWWKDSRASIVVELPKSHSVSDGMLEGEMVMVSDVIESLRSIGISIKVE